MVGNVAEFSFIGWPITRLPITTYVRIVGGYGSLHEKGIDGGERLAQQRDRNEVTNSRSESKKEQ
jgi:hypothetical protein